MIKLISAKEAAKKLKIDDSRVRVLTREGRLPAQKVGRTWVIDPADLKLVKDRRPGRPPDQKERQEMKKLIYTLLALAAI